MSRGLFDDLGLEIPILQAPMAGVSTPAMAAAVSNAGGLGGLGLGASTPEAAHRVILETQALTSRSFNVNLFCHAPAVRDSARERRWIERARPLFEGFDATPPETLKQIYASFQTGDAMLEVLLATRPAVVSFHFGLPRPAQIEALHQAGCRLIATATSLAEARQIAASGLDAIVAQGWAAGGHRGVFDPSAPDERQSTQALTREIVGEIALPVIAAGGLMDGADVQQALTWGAAAAQLGTAFIGCPESAADEAYRARLASGADTVMTSAISGRPARCLVNRFTAWAEGAAAGDIAPYPCAYDLGKALNAAARARGESGFGAQWAGTGASRATDLAAGELVQRLEAQRQAASRHDRA
ncbi:nitronate monooxygenase [Salinicola salarius]|uniref:NAD(P)H-dependent flavin oxidoreductase n=1 Tax=Salinicola salarius TaxID=430457 RepID=UPI0023E36DEF|nr:nitronate monooxygenase [Salinicola salarius]MDF3918642.1 nitronate monooxygenase [Salinicola salarius]